MDMKSTTRTRIAHRSSNHIASDPGAAAHPEAEFDIALANLRAGGIDFEVIDGPGDLPASVHFGGTRRHPAAA